MTEAIFPPPGGRILSYDEAVQIIKSGDHVGSMAPPPQMKEGYDDWLLDLMKRDLIAICLMANGELGIGWLDEHQRQMFLRYADRDDS